VPPFSVAGQQSVSPTTPEPTHGAKRATRGSLEPIQEAEDPRDEEMDRDELGEEGAIRTKRPPSTPSAQEVAAHEAGGHYPYRDWCRACVGGCGRADSHKVQKEEQNQIPVAGMDYGFFTDGDEKQGNISAQEGAIPKGATVFLVVKVKPSMMMYSTVVRCKGAEDQAAIKETVEALNRLGYPEIILRSDNEPAMKSFKDAVAKDLRERFGVRVITQATPKYDSASAGMIESGIKAIKEKVRTLVIAARELHGVVIGPDHVALEWCIRFAGQILSRTVKGADGLTAFQRAFQRRSHPRALPAPWGEKVLYMEASKKKVQLDDKFKDGIFLGMKDGSEELVVGTPFGCFVCRSVKR